MMQVAVKGSMRMKNTTEILETPDYMVTNATGGMEKGRLAFKLDVRNTLVQEAQRCQQWILIVGETQATLYLALH